MPKDDLRVEAYGTVDELSSALGLAAAASRDDDLTKIIALLQNRLFDLGAQLATPPPQEDRARSGGTAEAPRIVESDVRCLEELIDRICEPLPDLKHFILPGGSELAARLHAARTICRRAERLCVSLARLEHLESIATVYLNRLSDLLFAMARRANQLEGVKDVVWKADRGVRESRSGE